MTEEIKQCYRALDLEPGATPAEVKVAWRELVKVWHPDRFPNDAKLKAKGAAKLRDINRAYEILEAHLKPQQPSQDRSTENKTSREYRPGPPPKEQKESQPKKPSKAVAIYIGAMIVGSLFIGLDVLRVSLAEKREEEKQQAIAIKATRASEEVERLRLAATLEQQKKDEEAKVQKQKQELIDVSRRLATLEQQAARAAEKAADDAKLLAAAQERERQRMAAEQANLLAKSQARVASAPVPTVAAVKPAPREIAPKKQTTPATGQPWENSLGMTFVPVANTTVLFSIFLTRVQDFEAFVRASGHNATAEMSALGPNGWLRGDYSWKSPGFKQGPTHPVCGVSWDDAQAFCAWLTQKEQSGGRPGPKRKYRLPTDAEWSIAVGLGWEAGDSPAEKHGKIGNIYSWGNQWPPPRGAGNFLGTEARDSKLPSDFKVIEGYNDGYAYTSPVGAFAPNQFGLYDMSGNLAQWCEDFYYGSKSPYPPSASRPIRGSSFTSGTGYLLSSLRFPHAHDDRSAIIGFRVVVATGGP